ncbi:MAG: hypothetical protein A3H63_01700 [Candidatus Harrisonbacteria bacterium RIFCSPLOWO2_02_FULL_45_10c]|uniref:Uncharacterized protein n=1 Tax=Candidatus Harrisonbacteria bacterium RIFCSPLOWO2_02_FULL_45_10c TaxID=1798410 RepID=A0A1G1ZTI6_9BACT|nr:MAG: hypothetical protein A3H63_01700 [Candidatus Harrisonbacteria bacterium RIFCSPLOWO2_02_FULL_45_10c]
MPRPRLSNPAEEVVEKVLEKMAEAGAISGFFRNRPNDRLDEEGMDFLIILKNKLALPLQVKTANRRESCEDKFRKHKKKHPLVNFLICVPVGLLASDSERVYREVERDLKSMINA